MYIYSCAYDAYNNLKKIHYAHMYRYHNQLHMCTYIHSYVCSYSNSKQQSNYTKYTNYHNYVYETIMNALC